MTAPSPASASGPASAFPPVPFPPGLVWLSSYPKSGNTWLRILLSTLYAGQAQDINALALPSGLSCHSTPFLQETLLDPGLLTAPEIARLRPALHDHQARSSTGPLFLKCEEQYQILPDGTPLLGRAARAAVYMVRDPRDVAVSLAHHSTVTPAGAVATLTTPGLATPNRHRATLRLPQQHGSWSEHVTSWLDQTALPVQVVRYEDLLADPPAVLAALLTFLGINAPAATVQQAVDLCAFARLQQQEQSGDFRERQGETPFFRQGRAGGWRQDLPAALIHAIETAHGPVMDRLGYLRETTA